jgi:hypothetical protein
MTLLNKLSPITTSFRLSAARRLYSTTSETCTAGLVKPLNNNPIGYLQLPGLVKYDTALKLQHLLVSRRHQITQKSLQTDTPADIVCLLQHPPTFTAGRRIRGKTELEEEERLKSLGADYYEVSSATD